MPQVFIKDPVLNEVLAKMWAINNKLASGEVITLEERGYYTKYIDLVQHYYASYAQYWNLQYQMLKLANHG